MQVDEVAVIRLSPIVYNKELMKRVTGSDDPPVPASPKQSMSKSTDTELLRKEGGEQLESVPLCLLVGEVLPSHR